MTLPRVLAALLVLALPAAAAAQQRVDPLVSGTDDALVLLQIGRTAIARGELRLALQALEKSARLLPDNAETHMWMGVSHFQLDDLDAAERELRAALAIDPNFIQARNWYGVYWTRRGDSDRALQEYRSALAIRATPPIERARVLINLGNLQLQRNEVEEAMMALREASSGVSAGEEPRLYVMVRHLLADALIRIGEPRDALQTLGADGVGGQGNRLPETVRDEFAANGYFLAGTAHRDLGEREAAREQFNRVLLTAPGTEIAARARQMLESLGLSGSR